MANLAGIYAASHGPLIVRMWDTLTPTCKNAITTSFDELGRRINAARADVLVLNTQSPGLLGIPPTHLLDALVFAAADQPFARTLVAGRWVDRIDTATRFATAMAQLWPAAVQSS